MTVTLTFGIVLVLQTVFAVLQYFYVCVENAGEKKDKRESLKRMSWKVSKETRGFEY